MREIKFRAWVVDHGQTPPKGQMYYAVKDFHGNGKLLTYFEDRCVNEEDFLEQYTGLNDKDGVEIYEGDIIEGHIDAERCRWEIAWEETDDYCGWSLGLENLPVAIVANVHENPELLELNI